MKTRMTTLALLVAAMMSVSLSASAGQSKQLRKSADKEKIEFRRYAGKHRCGKCIHFRKGEMMRREARFAKFDRRFDKRAFWFEKDRKVRHHKRIEKRG